MSLTKEEQGMFPKTITTRYYKQDSDTRDFWNQKYAIETIVGNATEEDRFYEGLPHEANLVIEVKLPNGVIK